MSVNDAPAGDTGGRFSVSDLPEKLRVHALAKLLGRTSREVLAALAEIGSPVRSAQTGVDRETAEQVVTALVGRPGTAAEAGEDPASPVPSEAEVAPATPVTPEADPGSATPSAAGASEAGAAEAPAKPKRTRTRTPKAAPTSVPAAEAGGSETAGSEPGGSEAAASEGGEQAPAKPRRTRRKATRAGGALAEQTPEADTAPASEQAAEQIAGEASDLGEPALSPLFAAPAPLFQSAEPKRARRRKADTPEPAAQSEAPPEAVEPAEAPRRRRRARAEAEPVTEEGTEEETAEDAAQDQDAEDEGAGRRRRRRGRRGRGRGRGENGDGETTDEESAEDESDAEDSEDAEDSADSADSEDAADSGDAGDSEDEQEAADEGGSRRRRRRRRRKASGDSSDDGTDDDPPNTVTRVRAPRERDTGDDGVQSVRGSTRLEAKRQRRRDGRDAGRRRPPIVSESEFLARRESVERTMVIRQTGNRNEIGVLEDGVLVEHFIAGGAGQSESMVGNIYLGRVQNVLPSMEAAFVDIGRGRNAVLYAGEVDWDAAGLNGKARRIEQALSSGDSVLVQVTKDPVGHKGARLTTQISLAGRFLVYVPSGGAAGISRKLPDVERKRLKDMLKEIVPSEAGVIIRTASEGVSHEALERDVRRLQAQWEVVKEKAEKTGPQAPKAPTLLYEEPDLLVKVVRDQFNEDFSALVVSGDAAWDTVSEYVSHTAPELAERMHRHVGPKDVFAEYRIDEQLLKALDRKVWLPSGGTLVIDRTEAMTVIDVNTGKFTGSGGNLEETVTRNNLEAAEEVVRQLRLRDVGGIIVIDFIDMVLEANRDLVLRRLTECLARDRTRHQVAEVTSLGLVQMTRKRVGGGLLEHFSTTCEHCRGRGVIVNVDGVEPKQDNGQNGNGHREEGGGRRRNRRGREERPTPEPERNGRNAAAAAAVALVAAAANHEPDESSNAVLEPVPGAEVPEAPAGMDEVDTGRPAKRRGRRRAERPAGGTGAAEPVVVTTEAGEAAEVSGTAGSAEVVEAAEAGEVAGTAEVAGVAGTVEVAVEPEGAAAVAESEAPEAEPEAEPEAVTETVTETEVEPESEPDEAAPVVESAPVVEPAGPVTGEPATGLPATGTPPVAAERAEASEAEQSPAPRRRRGRVTRSAGAPVAAAEPVVVTTPAPEPVVAEQPEPTVETAVVTRPRRSRRGASRPAGPPVDGEDAAAVTVTVGAQGSTGDPV